MKIEVEGRVKTGLVLGEAALVLVIMVFWSSVVAGALAGDEAWV